MSLSRHQMVDAAISALMETDLISVILSVVSDDVRVGNFEALGKCAAVCVGWRNAARLEALTRLEGWAKRARTMTLDIPTFAPLVCSMVGAMQLTDHHGGTFIPGVDGLGGDATDRAIAAHDPDYRGSKVAKLTWRFSNLHCKEYCYPPEEPNGPDRLRSYDADSDGVGVSSDSDDDFGDGRKQGTLLRIFSTFVIRFDGDHLRAIFGCTAINCIYFDPEVCAALELLLGGIRYSKHESSSLLWGSGSRAPEYTPSGQMKTLASHLQDVWFAHTGLQRHMNASTVRARLRAAQPTGPLRMPRVKMCHLRQALANYMRARDSALAKELWQTSPMEPQIRALGPEMAPLVRRYYAIDTKQSADQRRMHRYELRYHHGRERAREVRVAYHTARDTWAAEARDADSEAE